QHLARRLRHVARAGAPRIALLRVRLGEFGERRGRILAAGGRETPGADGRPYQVAHARGGGKPFREDRTVQPRDAQPLGTARRTRNYREIRRVHSRIADTLHRTPAGANREHGIWHDVEHYGLVAPLLAPLASLRHLPQSRLRLA